MADTATTSDRKCSISAQSQSPLRGPILSCPDSEWPLDKVNHKLLHLMEERQDILVPPPSEETSVLIKVLEVSSSEEEDTPVVSKERLYQQFTVP